MKWVLKNAERVTDGLTGLAAGYIIWFGVFGLPKVPVAHEFIGMGCSVAIGAAALKAARKAKFW